MKEIPERFIWAASIMRVHTRANVLEIGCGAGLMAAIIAASLKGGSLVAIDRSAPMIRHAQKRNQEKVALGIVQFMTGSFSAMELPHAFFDTIVAFNVNFFLKDSPKDFEQLRKVLKPDGTLFIFHQAPVEIDQRWSVPVSERIEANGFKVANVTLKKMKPTSAIALECKLKSK